MASIRELFDQQMEDARQKAAAKSLKTWQEQIQGRNAAAALGGALGGLNPTSSTTSSTTVTWTELSGSAYDALASTTSGWLPPPGVKYYTYTPGTWDLSAFEEEPDPVLGRETAYGYEYAICM